MTGTESVKRWHVSPNGYRSIVVAATLALALIIFTGAAVRLTDSGLGCEDWPTCSEDRVVPEWGFHPWIEFGNRLLSGVVAAAVALAALAAYRRRPRRNDLIPWAWGLVVGVLCQIVLGGITVMVDLHPLFVSVHFLLSAVLMWNALVLLARAGSDHGLTMAGVEQPIVNHSRVQVALATAVLVTGTLVTGTGPNSGDGRAERLGFDLNSIARVHSVTVWLFVLGVVALSVRLRQAPERRRRAQLVIGLAVVQGGIGYWQFFTGVPPLLVEIHVIGAVAVWCATLWMHLHLFDRTSEQLYVAGRDQVGVPPPSRQT